MMQMKVKKKKKMVETGTEKHSFKKPLKIFDDAKELEKKKNGNDGQRFGIKI